MPQVLISPPEFNQTTGPHRDALVAAGLTPFYPPKSLNIYDAKNLHSISRNVEAVLASTEPWNEYALEGSKLRVIARLGVGFDSVDIAAATKRNILVTITPGVVEDSVAEITIGLLLCLTRNLLARDRAIRAGGWDRVIGPRMAGKTFGILGLGRIGRAVALRAKGLQMKILATDPCADPKLAAEQGIEIVSFADLLARSDVVSAHAPAGGANNKLFNKSAFDAMKQGAIFLNTSRGGLVDEPALIEALESKKLYGAGLDVFEQEPLPANHPITKFDNVVLSSHMGGLDEFSLSGMAQKAAWCVSELYQGRWPEGCVINPELKATWKW
jgi:D-3-phosphoglycerate dehydrogenase